MQKKKNINTNKELHQCLVIMNYAIETINSIKICKHICIHV